MKKINLDNFGKDPKKQKKQQPAIRPTDAVGPVDLVIAPKKEAEKAKPKAVVAPKGLSLEEIYDSQSRMIYLFDVSGSMGEEMPGAKKSVDDFIWDETTLVNIRDRAADAAKQLADPKSPLYPDDSETVEQLKRFAALVGLDDEALKRGVIDSEMYKDMYIPTNWYVQRSGNKLAVVKQAAVNMVNRRYEKYPNALVGALMFSDNPIPMPFDNKEGLIESIKSMSTIAGTNIMNAINAATSACKRAPSPVNLHHLVLVTDGLDSRAVTITDMIPEFKKMGVVLDFIHIPSAHHEARYVSVVDAIRKTCEATGGEYVVVRTAQEFDQKFIAASTRLMLPPASE